MIASTWFTRRITATAALLLLLGALVLLKRWRFHKPLKPRRRSTP